VTDLRCDLTDLLTSSCSHCRGLDDQRKGVRMSHAPGGTQEPTVGARFEARYGGRCPACDDAIRADDTVGYLDDEVCCESCYTAAGGRRG
jgi:hypothetical protein